MEERCLYLIVDAGAVSEVRVGLLDERAAPIEGYSVADRDVVSGSYVDVVASWRGEGACQRWLAER